MLNRQQTLATKEVQEAKYFFFGQNFWDGLRITIAIAFPSILLAYFDYFELGLTLSLGAVCVSVVDNPGPVSHKRNAMAACSLISLLVAIITGLLRVNFYLLGAEIFIFSFFFSMFAVYGARVSAIGTAALLVMILTMDKELSPNEIIPYSLQIFIGGLWYTILSLSFSSIRPFRAPQRALGECIRETAKFLKIKADFYDSHTSLEEDYRKLLAQQVVVNEKQDAVRVLLFKTRQTVQEFTGTGRALVLTFVDSVDLYEQIVTMYYDYSSIREKFSDTGILDEISGLVRKLATQMEEIGLAIQSNIPYKKAIDYQDDIDNLKRNIDELEYYKKELSVLVLRKILVNLYHLNKQLRTMPEYFQNKQSKDRSKFDYSRFVTHQEFELKIFRNNFSFNSTVFKHSIRVAIACLFGFTATKFISYGHHSYWVLLTIVVILKPAFSLTKQRNYQRLIGTIAGGFIGILVLLYIKSIPIEFCFLLFFMIGAYSFQRINYIITVIFMTPYILILFKFLGMGPLNIIEERVFDTFMGSAIAFIASYLIFPSWESHQLKTYMQAILKANVNYLQVLANTLNGADVNVLDYKLARKDVYVSSANLSAAFQRMLSEPKNKQLKSKQIYQFVVLNHILSSNVATIASSMLSVGIKSCSGDCLSLVKRSIHILNESLQKLDPSYTIPQQVEHVLAVNQQNIQKEDPLLKEQLDFIHKLSQDVGKLSAEIQ